MRVFIGCSSQGAQDVEVLADLIRKANMTPIPWSSPDAFVLNAGTWETLLAKTKETYAAAFLFREDDEVKRGGQPVAITRDNVVLEFGLFSGVLGPRRCAIVMKGNPWIPTDLKGITYVSLDDLAIAEQKICSWAKRMRNDIFVIEQARRNLNEKQIAAIARAMLRTGIPQTQVYKLMEKLGVAAIAVEDALGHLKRAKS